MTSLWSTFAGVEVHGTGGKQGTIYLDYLTWDGSDSRERLTQLDYWPEP